MLKVLIDFDLYRSSFSRALLIHLNGNKKSISRFVPIQYASKAFEGEYVEIWMLRGTGKSLKRLSLNMVLYMKMYWKSRQINWNFWIWYVIKILITLFILKSSPCLTLSQDHKSCFRRTIFTSAIYQMVSGWGDMFWTALLLFWSF